MRSRVPPRADGEKRMRPLQSTTDPDTERQAITTLGTYFVTTEFHETTSPLGEMTSQHERPSW